MSDDTEDFDLDDLDSDDFDFGLDGAPGEDVPDDRDPKIKFTSNMLDGVKDSASDPKVLGKLARSALPSGYQTTVDNVDGVLSTGTEIYDEAKRTLGPTLRNAKRVGQRFMPKFRKVLPEKFADKLENVLQVDDGGTSLSVEKAREASIAQSLGNIFKAQAEHEAEKDEVDELKQGIRDRISDVRDDKSLYLSSQATNNLSKLVAYQDSITSKYQQKSLELKYRHLFATQDLLKLSEAFFKDGKTVLQAIAKNTGLPEIVKTQTNESFKEYARERLVGKTAETASEFASNFSSKLKENIKSAAKEKVGDINDLIDSFTTAFEGIADMQEMQAEMGMDSSQMAANMAGGAIFSGVGTKIGNFARTHLEKNEKVMSINEKLRYYNDDIPGFLNSLTKEDYNDNAIVDKIKEIIRDIAPSRAGENVIVQNNLAKEGHEPMSFDLHTRRSIVEIIPGYLARILQQVQIFNNGDQNTPLPTFDTRRERFSTLSDVSKKVEENVVKAIDVDALRDRLDDGIISQIDTEGKLSDDAKKALKRQILLDVEHNKMFDPTRLANTFNYNQVVGEKESNEIFDLFRNYFSMTDDGEVGDSGEAQRRRRETSEQFSRVRSLLPNIQEGIQKHVLTSDKEALRESGWVTDDKYGFDSVNYDKFWDLLAGDSEIPGAKPPTSEGGIKPKPTPPTTPPSGGDISTRPTLVVSTSGHDPDDFTGASTPPPTGPDYPTSPAAVGLYTDGDSTVGSRILEEAVVTRENVVTIQQLLESQRNSDSGEIEYKVAGFRELIDLFKKDNEEVPHTPEEMGEKVHVIDDPVSTTNKHLGNISDVLTAHLGGIHDIIIDFRKALGNTKKNVKRVGGFLGRSVGNVGKAVGGYLHGVGGLAKNLGIGGGSFIKNAGIGIGAALFGPGARIEKLPSDIYIKGEKEPRILAKDLEEDNYFDHASGKPIHSVKDIKGPVVDALGNIVISAQDIEIGIRLPTGKDFKLPGILGLAGSVKDKMLGMAGGYYGAVWGGTKKLASFAMSGKRKLLEYANRPVDVYVKGETQPRLLAMIFKNGGYLDKNGIPLKTVNDMNGNVYDLEGNVVLSIEDAKKGLVDSKGVEINVKTLTSLIMAGGKKALKLGKRALKLGGKAVKFTHDFGATVKDKIFKKAKGAKMFGDDILDSGLSDAVGKRRTRKKFFKNSADAPMAFSDLNSGSIGTFPTKVKELTLYAKLVNLNADNVERSTKPNLRAVKDEKPLEDQPMPTSQPDLRSVADGVKGFGDANTAANEGYGSKLTAVKDVASAKMEKITNKLSSVTDDITLPKVSGQDFSPSNLKTTFTKYGTDVKDRFKDRLPFKTFSSPDEQSSVDHDGLAMLVNSVGGSATKYPNMEASNDRTDEFADKLGDTFGERLKTIFTFEEEKGPFDRLIDIIKERLPKKEEVFGDESGDGFRDGGWRQRLYGEKGGNETTDDIGDGKKLSLKERISGESGISGKLAAALGLTGGLASLNPFSRGGDDEGGGMMDTAMDYLGLKATDSILGKAGKAGKKLLGAGKAGITKLGGLMGFGGKAAGAAKAAGAVKTAGTVAATAGKAGMLAKGLMGLKAAAVGLGTVLSAPVVLGAAAVAGAGYLAYRGYKSAKLKATPTPLEGIRLAQYGIEPTYEKHLVPVRILEQELAKSVTFNEKGEAIVKADSVKLAEEVAEAFGVNLEDGMQVQNWLLWYHRRFLPVFSTNHTAAYKASEGEVELTDVDKKLKGEQLNEFLKLMDYGDGPDTPYHFRTSPFPSETINTGYGYILQMINNAKNEEEVTKQEIKTKANQSIIGMNKEKMKTAKDDVDAASSVDVPKDKQDVVVTEVGLDGNVTETVINKDDVSDVVVTDPNLPKQKIVTGKVANDSDYNLSMPKAQSLVDIKDAPPSPDKSTVTPIHRNPIKFDTDTLAGMGNRSNVDTVIDDNATERDSLVSRSETLSALVSAQKQKVEAQTAINNAQTTNNSEILATQQSRTNNLLRDTNSILGRIDEALGRIEKHTKYIAEGEEERVNQSEDTTNPKKRSLLRTNTNLSGAPDAASPSGGASVATVRRSALTKVINMSDD